MSGHVFSEMWSGLLSRTTGPLKFRFVLQPLMATLLAVRSGLRDSRLRTAPFLWEFCEDPAERKQLMRDCWKSVGKVFILAVVLDCIYQVIVLRWIYAIDALIIAFLLAIIPYVIVRGPVNRIATVWKPPLPRSPAEKPAPTKSAKGSSLEKAV